MKILKIFLFLILSMEGILMAYDNVYKEKFDNGLTVLIYENHLAPVCALNFWVKTGAAYEGDEEKGISHFIEHMMFKGTEKRGVGEIDKEIKALGGYNNAFTSYDATNYIIVLPSEHFEKGLEIEYDVITNSVFDEKELEKEREVILNELYMGLDRPYTFLWQKLINLVFKSYYKDPIIGYPEILKKIKKEKLINYYKKFYSPDNLVIVIAGDVDAKKAAALIRETYGKLPKKDTEKISKEENKINSGLKYKAYSGKIDGRYLALSFNIPDALSEEIPALEILARILAGSESSILIQEIKEKKQLVDSIDTDIFVGKYGGIFVITSLFREKKYEETLQEIFSELEKIKNFGIKQEELDKVKVEIITEEAKENMKVENIALNLGYYEILKDFNFYYEYYDRLKRVTVDDIEVVAKKYFGLNNAGIVLYYPEKEKKYFEKFKDTESIKDLIQIKDESKESPVNIVNSKSLNNGIFLIHKKLNNTDIVAIDIIFKGGVIYEGGENQGYYRGITNLMLDVMMKGTKKKNALELAKAIDALGMSIEKNIRKDCFGWGVEILNSNFEPAIELLADIIINPAFELAEIKKEKQNIINSIERIKDNPEAYINKIYNEEFFEWHPYGFYIPGDVDSVNRIPSQKIKEWHSKYVKANNLIISVVGNIDFEKVESVIEKNFNELKFGKLPEINLPVKITKRKKIREEILDKNQTHILLGFLGPKMSSRDYFAFRVLDNILSGGMDSRLFSEIRDKKNLCYTIFSTFDRNIENGSFKIYTSTDPSKGKEVIDEILKILKDLKKNGVTEEEIKSAKNFISGMFKVGMQDYAAQADSYGFYEIVGLGYKKVDEFLDEIMKVEKEDIEDIIDRYIDTENYCLVILRPEKTKKR
ncbi:MAG: insulinase family protein [Candidatus Goldbacteria bacterium]|nr:insulinase family protein [Candidatus Goldiibacteriota bacterium]